jgi:hypothetical protein
MQVLHSIVMGAIRAVHHLHGGLWSERQRHQGWIVQHRVCNRRGLHGRTGTKRVGANRTWSSLLHLHA